MMNEHEYYCFLKEFWKVTNDGFIIVDPNGVIVDINETYCEFLGKTREQVLGKANRRSDFDHQYVRCSVISP